MPHSRPEPGEYLPRLGTYINLVPSGEDICDVLSAQREEISGLLRELSEEQGRYRYEPGKWSVKELIGHVSDAERMWAYRLLRIARNDVRELPHADRDVFVAHAGWDGLALADVLDDFQAVRQATITLVRLLPQDAWARTGGFEGHPLSARACVYTAAGHARHHLTILQERYL